MAKMISYPTDPTQMERIIEAGSAEARELDAARVCRSCGLRGGAHEADCRSVAAEARAQLQATCDHRREYGITQTTGEPLGPPRCGRCGIELELTTCDTSMDIVLTGSMADNYMAATGYDSQPSVRPRVAFRPERVFISGPRPTPDDATGWVINDITIGNISQFVNDPRRKIARSLRIAAKRLELAPNHRRALRDQADRLLGLLPMARGDADRRRRRAERVLAGGAMDFEI